MSSDSDCEEYVPDHSKRRIVVEIASDSDDDNLLNVTPVKRRRVGASQATSPPSGTDSPLRRRPIRRALVSPPKEDQDGVVHLDDSSSDDDDATNDIEIQMKLANDPVLQRTQAILRKVQPVDVVATDAFSGDDAMITLAVQWTPPSGSEHTERIRMPQTATFETLLTKFCECHDLAPAGVRFVFDGVAIELQDTPERYDLEDNDVVNAIVDFDRAYVPSSMSPAKPVSKSPAKSPAKDIIRVKVRRTGGKIEIYRISSSMPVQKLLLSFCNVHKLSPDHVTLKLLGDTLELDKTVSYYSLDATDVVEAACDQAIAEDPTALGVNLRFLPSTETETFKISTTALVKTLVQKVCAKRHLDPANVRFKIDGEFMHPDQPFSEYDLEGDELIDVVLS
ncbi:hypothetical protein SPRG_12879 [Saprolegnia parasitica CBS 223.65]|uniref:Ubiquitin-like domain-containing protein n=1 Tax=Saprolegnia parasitica (strain CBS 223.65) TaxID=695850 RepID=A0A067BTQ2_SAPPC|nr:hypothetical protein SPRG_12879 [Saprolegnia parasitica CBS 223.65]KDO21638.1 hypothetical protein SPRG_12879 [Saprolegnia parasitica CBS 223.65]|eukprot:XP_012207650.1 hypothetical protein SPRG_12879 [Saprolegnia parasitica CBS 223.65]